MMKIKDKNFWNYVKSLVEGYKKLSLRPRAGLSLNV